MIAEALTTSLHGLDSMCDIPSTVGFSTDASTPSYTSSKKLSNFHLVEKLGEGGMGFVYRAEQYAPIRRTVAIKQIVQGRRNAEVIARFKAERQALASMNHPNIAAIYEAGIDDCCLPYAVLEYVPGIPITRFCDENRLTIHERLELFIQVCDAIGHAHSKSVVHRDIKAANVLAYFADGKPRAKVIDFGIAKMLNAPQGAEDRLKTYRAAIVGTLSNMSPEQVSGSPDVDAKSDVYSLGVLLYELLTGGMPFQIKAHHSACYDEVRQMICEQTPPSPADRVRGQGSDADSVSRRRQLTTGALIGLLKGELGWIPARAMHKQQSKRYATPKDLARDIKNYIAGRPLVAGLQSGPLAGPRSAMYQMRKTFDRNRAAVLTAAGCLLVLSASATAFFRTVSSERARTFAAMKEVQNLKASNADRVSVGLVP